MTTEAISLNKDEATDDVAAHDSETIDPESSDQESRDQESSDTGAPQVTRSAPRLRRGPSSTSTRGTRGSVKALTIVLGALLAVMTAAAAFFGYQYIADSDAPSTGPSQEVRDQALSTARDYAIKLSSFDYRDLNKNRESITATSTPDFAKKYDEMVTALTQIVQNGKGEATATVSHAAIEKIDDQNASVILFVDQEAKNVASPDGRTQPYRMLVTLKRSDNTWLVDNVETK